MRRSFAENLELAFDDPALEAAWAAWFAAERARVVRGGVAVMVIGLVTFAPFDPLLYPGLTGPLLTWRVATLALVAVAFPALFGRDSDAALARHGQEWLLYVCTVVFVGLGGIGLTLLPGLGVLQRYATLLAFGLVLSGLYGATGLRFRYAAGLGLLMSATYLAVVLASSAYTPGFLLAVVMFGGALNLLGLTISWTMEREARRSFLRGRELEREHARAEALLLNIMPGAYAARLAQGAGACVDRLPDVTVLFATVVGFEAATADHPPLDSVALLDRIVGTFDALAAAHGVERIKTIGATYMAAALGPDPVAATHASLELALAMRAAVRRLAREEGLAVALRVGVAAGPVVVGVIGRSRYAFDCWGDTVNTASRLDGAGEPDRVHATLAAGERAGSTHVVVARGRVAIKGKGELDTCWVEPR